MSAIKRLLPYAVFVLAVFGTGLYAGGYVWSSSILEFNVTSGAFFANWTQRDWVDPYAFNITIGNNLSNTATWIVLNITNTTLIRTSAGEFAEIIVNNTANLNQLNISSFATANITIRFNVSLLNPGRYTGNLTVTNSSNAGAKINNLTVRLDVPITPNETASRSKSFFGNITTLNSVDVFYINVTNTSGFYVNVNDSRLDLLLFDNGTNLVAFNNTNSSSNRTLFHQASYNNAVYELRIFYNTTSVSQYIPYNGIVEFSYLNSSLRFLHFAANATPDAATATRITFTLNNTNRVNYTTVTETETISRFELRVNMQNSTNITIPVPGYYTSIDALIEWNNISADFNLTVYNSSGISVSNQSKRNDMFNVTGLDFNRIFSRSTANVNEFNKSWFVSVKGDPLVYYNLTIKINMDNSWLGSSFGNYTRQFVLNSTQENATVDFNVSVPQLSADGVYNGTISFRAGTGHYMVVPFGVNVTAPMLMVNNTFSGILLYVVDNVGANKTLDYLLTVNNTGSYALTLNHTNTTWLNDSGTNTVSYNYSFETPIAALNSTLLRIRLNITTQTTSSGESVYYGWIKLNASNAHPYTEFLVNVTLNLTNKLNVIVNNVTNQTDKGLWINPINKTENYTKLASTDPVFVNVSINVTYQNGTFVSGLNATNFTVWLQTEFPYEGSNYTLNFTNVTVMGVLNAIASERSYAINISIPSTIAGGNYSVYATVVDGQTFRNGGTAKFNYLYVNSSALAIDAYNGTHDSDEFFNTGNRDVFVNVTNVGGGALSNVTLELSLSGSCTMASGYASTHNLGNLTGFGRYTNASATWKVTINANSTCTATIVGSGPPGVWILNDTLIYAYKGTTISPGGTGGPSGGGSGGGNALALAITTDKTTYFKSGTANFNFTVTSGGSNIDGSLVKFNITDPKGVKTPDSSCTTAAGKCSGSYMLPANVIGTFKISASATKDSYTAASASRAFDVAGYNATITVYAKSVYVLQGSSNTTRITVRNSGSFDSLMSLAIKDIDASWWKATPANASITAGSEAGFDANFNIPANAVVGNYTGKYSIIADSEIASGYFYLVVMPTEKTKAEINATILNYTDILRSLMERLNITSFTSGNSTELGVAADKVNLAAALLAQANESLQRGDYVKASELAVQSKVLIDAAEALIKTVEARQGGKRFENILTVGGVVAGVILAGLLIYTLLPEPGYSPTKGYTIPEHTGPAGKAKMRFKFVENFVREIIEKLKELAEKVSGAKKDDVAVR
ncbi:MAG: hypothetical protein HY516_04355 [Candidatus Aenigmarchaeota archaeon]|nr:hypothetical protein [Candidatus Aenigmarchaeota archaeon]